MREREGRLFKPGVIWNENLGSILVTWHSDSYHGPPKCVGLRYCGQLWSVFMGMCRYGGDCIQIDVQVCVCVCN